jgi:hypothetical protein
VLLLLLLLQSMVRVGVYLALYDGCVHVCALYQWKRVYVSGTWACISANARA